MKNRRTAHSMRHIVLRKKHDATTGLTLPEVLVVMVIIGVLATMSAPTWLGLFNNHNLSTAQGQAYLVLQDAQSKADLTRTSWQASFRMANGLVEAAAHPSNSVPVSWETVSQSVRIDAAETTLTLNNGIYLVQFNQTGRVNGQLGRITFAGNSGGSARRCVMVSTLLGALRKGQNHTTPDSGGRYCY